MKKITKYVAEDGVEFLNEEECITHENNVQHIFEEIDGFQNTGLSRRGCGIHPEGFYESMH